MQMEDQSAFRAPERRRRVAELAREGEVILDAIGCAVDGGAEPQGGFGRGMGGRWTAQSKTARYGAAGLRQNKRRLNFQRTLS